jgi:hypothetical protein
MDIQPKLLQRPPNSLSESELRDFIALVRSGGEVSTAILEHNVRTAESLLTAHDAKGLLGVAALKRPALSYRNRIADKSGVRLELELFPLELGYVFITPIARRLGLATKLCDLALKERDGVGVFATTRVANATMARVLQKVGFEARGRSYISGRGKYELQLFLRPPRAAAAREGRELRIIGR